MMFTMEVKVIRFDSSFARMIGAETDLSFFSIASRLIFSWCFPPSLMLMMLLLVWVPLNKTNWNKIIFYILQGCLNFLKWISCLLNDKYRYFYSTPILCYLFWIYNSQPAKKELHTKKGRNIFNIVDWRRSLCFSLWIHATIKHLSFLVIFVLAKFTKAVTLMYSSRDSDKYMFFSTTQKLKHLTLPHPNVICVTDLSLNLWERV